MIRRLADNDRAELFALLDREPEINAFIIGDVENYGFESEAQDLWGNVGDGGAIDSVLLRFYDNLCLYAPDDPRRVEYVKRIRELDARVLSGGVASIDPIADALPFPKIKRTYLCRMNAPDAIDAPAASMPLRTLTPDDMDAMLELYGQVDGLGETPRDSAQAELEAGNARGYWIGAAARDDADAERARMVSVARTAAESTRAAVIIGVATHPDSRGLGHATALMAHLCRELLEEGKSPCLFYDNPAAGRIYQRLGFEDVGEYMILTR
jgi:hypothetical protein